MSSCWTTEGFGRKSPGGASSRLQTEAPGDLRCICSRPLPLCLLPPCSCRQPLQNVSSVPCWSHRGWKRPSGPPSPAISLTYGVPSPCHVPTSLKCPQGRGLHHPKALPPSPGGDLLQERCERFLPAPRRQLHLCHVGIWQRRLVWGRGTSPGCPRGGAQWGAASCTFAGITPGM